MAVWKSCGLLYYGYGCIVRANIMRVHETNEGQGIVGTTNFSINERDEEEEEENDQREIHENRDSQRVISKHSTMLFHSLTTLHTFSTSLTQ